MKIGGTKLRENIKSVQNWLEQKDQGPLVVEISPTYGCIHNCIHCSYQQYNPYSKKKTFIDPDIFYNFLHDFKQLGGIEVYFAGNGEPLIHPSISDMIAYGNKMKLNMALSTNGVLLTPQKTEEILPHLKWIRVSINGGDRDTYAKVHNCPAQDFDKLISNLRYAIEYRNKNNLDAKLFIQFLIYDANWKSAYEMAAIHNSIKTDQLIFRNVVFNDQICVPDHDMMEMLRKIENKNHIKVRWETFQHPSSKIFWKKCYGINFHTNIDHNGNLFTCSRHFFYNCCYGNIHKEKFTDIWLSKSKKDFFSFLQEDSDKTKCREWCSCGYDNVFIEEYLNRQANV